MRPAPRQRRGQQPSREGARPQALHRPAQALLLRRGVRHAAKEAAGPRNPAPQQRADLAASFHRSDNALVATTRVTDARWEGEALQLGVVTSWHSNDPTVPRFDLSSGRVVRVVEPEVRAALPPELLDYTDDLDQLGVEVAVRSRKGHITWQLPYQGEPPRFETVESTGLSLLKTGRVTLDTQAARLGRPLDNIVWDVRTRTNWVGMTRAGALAYTGPERSQQVKGRAANACSNTSGNLSVDLRGKPTRTAGPRQAVHRLRSASR